jgi:formiminoglutamase
MNPELYFKEVDFDFFQKNEKFNKTSLGGIIQKETGKYRFPGNEKVRIALLGVPFEMHTHNKGTSRAPAEIRKHLYQLSDIPGLTGICDLGDLKPGKTENDTYFALRDVIENLSDAGIVSIVLGGGQDLGIGIARAFKSHEGFTLSVVDPRIDVKKGRETTGSHNFLSRILLENPKLFDLQMIGIQSHWVSSHAFDFLGRHSFDYISLGHIHENLAALEPVLRNTNFLSFDISSIKQSDACGYIHPSPNGLYGEEACQLARYAGLSPRLKVFGLFETNPDYDKSGMTTELAAQIIWYFIEGLTHRRMEDPATDGSLFTKYYVENELNDAPLVFYHHPSTNRWWIEIPDTDSKSWEIACGENDYSQAVKQEIPEIWWKYSRKSERHLKYSKI